jgi:predicted subunit of tRNA(5-methylaminomethyl-2-thiouridylate) methyltransferase
LNLNPRHQRVILEEIKTQLEYHKKDKGMDYFAYRWLENHYHHLKENPSSISKKTKWEVEIEKPLINLFKNLKVKFQFSNSLQHKKTV